MFLHEHNCNLRKCSARTTFLYVNVRTKQRKSFNCQWIHEMGELAISYGKVDFHRPEKGSEWPRGNH